MMKKLRSNLAVLGLGMLGISGCTIDADGSAPAAQATDAAPLPVLVRQSVRNATTMQALFIGRLHLDANGCLRGDSETGPIIIWHHDTRLEPAPDGRIRVADVTTGNMVHVGDEIALSGGYREGPVTNVTEPVPQACRAPSRYFIAGPVMSEAQRRDLLRRGRNRPAPSSPAEKR